MDRQNYAVPEEHQHLLNETIPPPPPKKKRPVNQGDSQKHPTRRSRPLQILDESDEEEVPSEISETPPAQAFSESTNTNSPGVSLYEELQEELKNLGNNIVETQNESLEVEFVESFISFLEVKLDSFLEWISSLKGNITSRNI